MLVLVTSALLVTVGSSVTWYYTSVHGGHLHISIFPGLDVCFRIWFQVLKEHNLFIHLSPLMYDSTALKILALMSYNYFDCLWTKEMIYVGEVEYICYNCEIQANINFSKSWQNKWISAAGEVDCSLMLLKEMVVIFRFTRNCPLLYSMIRACYEDSTECSAVYGHVRCRHVSQ